MRNKKFINLATVLLNGRTCIFVTKLNTAKQSLGQLKRQIRNGIDNLKDYMQRFLKMV